MVWLVVALEGDVATQKSFLSILGVGSCAIRCPFRNVLPIGVSCRVLLLSFQCCKFLIDLCDPAGMIYVPGESYGSNFILLMVSVVFVADSLTILELIWQASEPLNLPYARLTSTCYHTRLSLWVLVIKLSLHACMANSLLTELCSPYPYRLGFHFIYFKGEVNAMACMWRSGYTYRNLGSPVWGPG